LYFEIIGKTTNRFETVLNQLIKIVEYSFNSIFQSQYRIIVTMKMRNKQLSRDLQNQILPMLIGLEEGEEEESYCNLQ